MTRPSKHKSIVVLEKQKPVKAFIVANPLTFVRENFDINNDYGHMLKVSVKPQVLARLRAQSQVAGIFLEFFYT